MKSRYEQRIKSSLEILQRNQPTFYHLASIRKEFKEQAIMKEESLSKQWTKYVLKTLNLMVRKGVAEKLPGSLRFRLCRRFEQTPITQSLSEEPSISNQSLTEEPMISNQSLTEESMIPNQSLTEGPLIHIQNQNVSEETSIQTQFVSEEPSVQIQSLPEEPPDEDSNDFSFFDYSIDPALPFAMGLEPMNIETTNHPTIIEPDSESEKDNTQQLKMRMSEMDQRLQEMIQSAENWSHEYVTLEKQLKQKELELRNQVSLNDSLNAELKRLEYEIDQRDIAFGILQQEVRQSEMKAFRLEEKNEQLEKRVHSVGDELRRSHCEINRQREYVRQLKQLNSKNINSFKNEHQIDLQRISEMEVLTNSKLLELQDELEFTNLRLTQTKDALHIALSNFESIKADEELRLKRHQKLLSLVKKTAIEFKDHLNSELETSY